MPWSRVALAVCSFGLARGLEAQEAPPEPVTVSGQVVDATSGTPLEGAAITVDGATLRAFTDADGRFSFRTVPPGEHVWVIRRLGYATWEQPFTAAGFDQLRIGLMPNPVALESITVTVDRLEARRAAATLSVHTVTHEDLRSSPATLALDLLASRAPWAVVQCPDDLGATVYPLDQENPPDESTLVDPGQRPYVPTEFCIRYRGRSIRPAVCLDDRPINGVELLAFGSAEIYAIDFVGGARPQVRLYTERFLEKRRTVRPFTVPCY
jgi:hypothetical protein